MRLIVEPVWHWPWVALAGVAMYTLVLWTYPARLRGLTPGWRRTLLALRLATATLLFFALLRPAIQTSETDRQQTELFLLLDSSRSMTTPDGPGGLTRREAVVKLLADQRDVLERLGREVTVRLFDFSDSLQPVATATPEADGPSTALGKAIDSAREQARSEGLLGVVLLSDGAQRAVGEDNINPLQAARRLAEQQAAPLHAVMFGASELSTSGLDLAVEDLSLDQPVTFERKTVPVRFRLRLLGAAGRKVKVKLLLEDRTGRALGESGPLKEAPFLADAVPQREVQTRENAELIPMELSFVADQPGDFKFAVEVEPAEGEVRLNNNRIESLITVRRGGLRVAYLDVPRPEQKFLHRLNETAQVQLDEQVVLPGRFSDRSVIDPALFKPGAYDVYLIGDVPASAFTGANENLLTELAARVREGSGLAMLGGLRNFGAGGYAVTALRDLLPVRMSPADRLGPDEVNPESQIQKPLRMIPTPDGERHYLMRLSGQDNQQAWRNLPLLSGAARLVPKSGAADILAESEAGEPLLIAADTGRGRVLALAVDETWKWHLHGAEAEHQRFWQQLVLWLARKEFESDQPVWVRVEPRSFSPQARVPIEFGAQDEAGQPLVDAEFQAEVLLPDGTQQPLSPQRGAEGGLATFAQTNAAGDYWARVTATRAGQSLGPSAMTRFVVNDRDLEMDQPAADPGMLSQLAALTGGAMMTPEEFGGFLETLLAEGLPSDLQRQRRRNLWDNWGLLLGFVSLMSLEWGFRKWKGLV